MTVISVPRNQKTGELMIPADALHYATKPLQLERGGPGDAPQRHHLLRPATRQRLGHANLETTQIYRQVSIRKLQEIHAATHPGAKRGHYEGPDGDEGQEADAEELLKAIANEDDEAAETTEMTGNT